MEAERKVVIMDEAESMNVYAANALLKTLEEPPGRAVLVLVSGEPERLPATIVSRCYQVRFRPLRLEEIRSYLTREMRQTEERADLLARASGGVFRRALSYLEDEERLACRLEAVEMARRLSGASVLGAMEMAGRIVEMADGEAKRYRRRADEDLRALKEALDPKAFERLEKRRKSRQDREASRQRFEVFCDVFAGLASWYRDVMVQALALEEDDAGEAGLVNRELAAEIREAARRIDAGRAVDAVRECEAAAAMLSRNANALLLVENLLLKLEEVSSGAPRRPPLKGRGGMG